MKRSPVAAAAEPVVPLALRTAAEGVLGILRVVLAGTAVVGLRPSGEPVPGPPLGHHGGPGAVQEDPYAAAPVSGVGRLAGGAGAVAHVQERGWCVVTSSGWGFGDAAGSV